MEEQSRLAAGVFLLVLALTGIETACSAQPAETVPIVRLDGPNASEITLVRSANAIKAIADDGPSPQVGKRLADFLLRGGAVRVARTDEAGTSRYYALAVSVPSRPDLTPGYCGRENEGYLVLVEQRGRLIELRDTLLLASCLHDVEMLDKEGMSSRSKPVTELIGEQAGDDIAFRWVSDGPGMERHAEVKEGRWSLTLRPARQDDGNTTP